MRSAILCRRTHSHAPTQRMRRIREPSEFLKEIISVISAGGRKAMSRLNEIIKENTYVLGLVGVIATILALFITADSYLDSKIEQKITDTAYIKKLSNQLRPFLIFNDQGVVTFDHGAYEKIKNIDVNLKNKNIIIETTEYLQNAPFIIKFGADTYSFEVERIGSKKWRYNMLYYDFIAATGGSKKEPKTVFMLEIF